MPAEGQRTRIAVLIDADNASPRYADAIFVEIAKLGEAIVRRVYGDFSSQGLKGWNDKLSRHALVPVQTVAYTKGKNASDISLVIDAMDLMHQGVYDAFCIVSSDSDFTRLAQRLRESGAEVYGLGERKAPESFRQSCRRFFFVENLARDQAAANAAGAEPELALPEQIVHKATDAVPTISRAYEQHVGDHADGWVPIRVLQRTIANFEADFDPRTYGEQRLGDLAAKTGAFEVKHLNDRKWSIRAKVKAKTQPAAPQTAGRPATPPRQQRPAEPPRTNARPETGRRSQPPQPRIQEDENELGGVHRTIAKAGPIQTSDRQPARKPAAAKAAGAADRPRRTPRNGAPQ